MWNRWYRGICIWKPTQTLYLLVALGGFYGPDWKFRGVNFEVWNKGVKKRERERERERERRERGRGRGTILDTIIETAKSMTITAVCRSTVMSILWCPSGNLRSFHINTGKLDNYPFKTVHCSKFSDIGRKTFRNGSKQESSHFWIFWSVKIICWLYKILFVFAR